MLKVTAETLLVLDEQMQVRSFFESAFQEIMQETESHIMFSPDIDDNTKTNIVIIGPWELADMAREKVHLLLDMMVNSFFSS